MTRVPVIYRDGRVEVSVRGQAFGTATGVVPIRARAVRVTPLARMLAPPRRPRSAAVPAISLGVVGFFFLVVLNIGVASEGGFGVWPAAMALLVLGALCGAMVWSRRRSTRATAGMSVGRAGCGTGAGTATVAGTCRCWSRRWCLNCCPRRTWQPHCSRRRDGFSGSQRRAALIAQPGRLGDGSARAVIERVLSGSEVCLLLSPNQATSTSSATSIPAQAPRLTSWPRLE